jgi:hypothetical protein
MREDLLMLLFNLSTQQASVAYQKLLSFIQPTTRVNPKLAEKQFQKSVESKASLSEFWELLACVREVKGIDEIGSIERVLLMDANVGEHALLDNVRQVIDKKRKLL